MRIAVLTQDADQARLVLQAMAALHHACHVFQDLDRLLKALHDASADLIIADDEATSVDTVHAVRGVSSAPLMLLVSRSGEDALVAALNAGANEYMVKPARRAEMQLRVRVLFERSYPGHAIREEVGFGRYVFEPGAGRLRMDGAFVELTRKEFEVALLLFRHLGRPLSRATLREAVWSHEPDLPSRTIDTHVSRVRTKLGLRPENGYRLVPVYSFGYQLEEIANDT